MQKILKMILIIPHGSYVSVYEHEFTYIWYISGRNGNKNDNILLLFGQLNEHLIQFHVCVRRILIGQP